MADPIHYIVPIVDPKTAMRVAALALWLWPVLVTATIALVRWRTLRSRTAFLVMGYLVCVGVSALIARLGGYYFWAYGVNSAPQDKLVVALVNESIGATAIGILFSVVPVIWLASLLDKRRPAI
jgi:thiol:disulfide interchange protein